MTGGPGVHDLDFGRLRRLTQHYQMTMDDVVSFESFVLFFFSGVSARSRVAGQSMVLYFGNSLEDHRVSGQLVLDKVAWRISVWQRCRPLQLALTAQLLRRREGVLYSR